MAAFTSKAAGNWSSAGQTTWNQAGVPGSGDTVTITHAITIDADTTIDGITFSAGLTLAATKTLSLRGTVIQADATFTMAAGSILQATSGAVKWLQGTAYSQALCKIVANGVIGSHCQIKKNGATSFYFDGGEEGSAAFGNCGGWDLTYTDLTALGHPSLAWSIRSNDFGLHHRRFNHCVFDNCKYQFARTYNWDANGNTDWQVQYCAWINQPAGASGAGMNYIWGSTGSGSLQFNHNSVGEPSDATPSMTIAARSAHIDDNYFDSAPALSGSIYASFLRNTVRMSANTQSCRVTNGQTAMYVLCDHVDPADRIFGVTHVGNPHIMESFGTGTFDGLVLEYPHELLIDGGDGVYGSEDGSFAGAILQYILVLPSMTDGVAGTNVHPMVQQNNQIKMYHCTVVGKIAQLVFNERNVSGTTPVLDLKSSMAIGVSPSTAPPEWAAGCYDLHGADIVQPDPVVPANIKNNNIWQALPDNYNDGTGIVPGDAAGWHVRLTTPPDGTNLSVDPQFVDDSRNAARWAVYKAYVAAEPAQPALPVSYSPVGAWATWLTWKRAALDAVRVALMADPTLGYSDLMPWVKDGFAPQNAVLQNAGHDGITIGAVEYTTGGPPPPPAPTAVALVVARQAMVYVP